MDHTFLRQVCAVLSVLVAAAGQKICAGTIDSETVLRLEVSPAAIELSGRRQSMQIVVTGHLSGGAVADVTRDAVYSISDPDTLSITPVCPPSCFHVAQP